MNILIEEPPEYNPVDLIRLAQQASPTLRYRHFAIAFKASPNTVARWMCGSKNPSKMHRIWAAELKRRWQL
jgi:DNA-binding transcriptional regulator YiaG